MILKVKDDDDPMISFNYHTAVFHGCIAVG
jgi:hypothetical protein